MPRFNLLVAILVTVATLGLAPSAAAHYNPVKGRWLERDPAGYADGSSLYQFSRSDPIGRHDVDGRCSTSQSQSCTLPTGHKDETVPLLWPDNDKWKVAPKPHKSGKLKPRHESCCNAAKNNYGAKEFAVTVCCGGERIVCVFQDAASRYPLASPPEKAREDSERKIREQIDACMIQHERRHARGQKWKTCSGVPDGEYARPPSGQEWRDDCEHCEIYKAHVTCIEQARKQCKANCETLEKELEEVRRLSDLHCPPKTTW